MARAGSELRPQAPDHFDVQLPYLLAQRIAVEAEKLGGANLVAARSRKRDRDQRPLHFADDAVVEGRTACRRSPKPAKCAVK